jgi:hypothetical protein
VLSGGRYRRLAFRFAAACGFERLPLGELMTPLSAADFSDSELGWFAALAVSVR